MVRSCQSPVCALPVYSASSLHRPRLKGHECTLGNRRQNDAIDDVVRCDDTERLDDSARAVDSRRCHDASRKHCSCETASSKDRPAASHRCPTCVPVLLITASGVRPRFYQRADDKETLDDCTCAAEIPNADSIAPAARQRARTRYTRNVAPLSQSDLRHHARGVDFHDGDTTAVTAVAPPATAIAGRGDDRGGTMTNDGGVKQQQNRKRVELRRTMPTTAASH